jgi:ADP-heptose:LPS heptosyltransferase
MEKIEKILFLRCDRLGEFLLSLPAIKLVRENYPQAKICLMAAQDNIVLAKNVDFIDFFYDYDKCYRGYRGALRLAKFFKKEKFDCVVALHPQKEFHLASFFAGVKVRVGYNRKCGFCLTHTILDKKDQALKNEMEYNIDLVKLICPSVSLLKVDLNPDLNDDISFLKDKIDLNEKYIVFHPFTSDPKKLIGDEFWRILSQAVREKLGREIVIIGSAAEKKESLRYEGLLKAKSLAGQFNLNELAVFLKRNCRFFIGLDSGPMHLAAMLDLPACGLFKVSDPKRWGPWGGKVFVAQSRTESGFIDKIEAIIKFGALWNT